MDTALADRECTGLDSSDARMSCYLNKVVILLYVIALILFRDLIAEIWHLNGRL